MTLFLFMRVSMSDLLNPSRADMNMFYGSSVATPAKTPGMAGAGWVSIVL